MAGLGPSQASSGDISWAAFLPGGIPSDVSSVTGSRAASDVGQTRCWKVTTQFLDASHGSLSQGLLS